jgi:DNA/RNA endonuclease YhcR with UshA esterase domain
MKSLRTLTIASFLLLMGLLPVMAQTISAADAKKHIGEQATVCGRVASEKTAVSSRGEPTFINLDVAYPNQVFTILVWGDDRKSVGDMPQVGSHICATGLIKDFRGVPEIVVRSSGQFSR